MGILLTEDESVGQVVAGCIPFVLPAAVAIEAPNKESLQPPQCSATILFVDDEPSICEIAKLHLAGHGYRVIVASDGGEALQLWKQHADEIDLVVTDLMMPGGVDGRQAVGRMRADRPDLQAIFVSGYSAELQCEEDEAPNFLPKPYRLKDMSDKIRDCLKQENGIRASSHKRFESAGGKLCSAAR